LDDVRHRNTYSSSPEADHPNRAMTMTNDQKPKTENERPDHADTQREGEGERERERKTDKVNRQTKTHLHTGGRGGRAANMSEGPLPNKLRFAPPLPSPSSP
jgi:hypothetical protein